MAYCTTSDVQALNTKRPAYSASTTPTSTQVSSFVDQIAAEIDTVLEGRGFTTPVTSATTSEKFVAWLLALNARGAAALAEQAQFPDRASVQGTVGSASVYWAQYREGLKYLKEGAIPGGGGDTAPNPLPFSFREKNQANDAEPGEDDPAWSRHKFGINKEF